MKNPFFYLLLTSLTLSCIPHRTQISKNAYIIGSNDIKIFNDNHQKEITKEKPFFSVLIVTDQDEYKRKFCTGTLIAPSAPTGPIRVLTNRHCFIAGTTKDPHAIEDLLPGHCSSTKVFFGVHKDSIALKSMSTCSGGFRSDPSGDLAIFDLKDPPPTGYAPLALWQGPAPKVGTHAFVVHYPSFPEDMDKDGERSYYEEKVGIYLPYAQITEENCQLGEAFASSEWRFDKALPVAVKHDCDQLQGSSGSALVDKESFRLIGVNWGGIKLAKGPEIFVYNVATNWQFVSGFVHGAKKPPSRAPAPSVASSDVVVSQAAKSDKKEKKSFCGTLSGGRHQGWGFLFLPFLLLLNPFFRFRRG